MFYQKSKQLKVVLKKMAAPRFFNLFHNSVFGYLMKHTSCFIYYMKCEHCNGVQFCLTWKSLSSPFALNLYMFKQLAGVLSYSKAKAFAILA